MKKVRIINISNNDYVLSDNKNEYFLNMEFYSRYRPMVNDIVYISENILNNKTLYAFDDLYNDDNISVNDIIKIVSDKKSYYLQRIYG